jgi:plastocyanin
VNWVWGSKSNGHNIVPDTGNTPESSGALANAPHTYSFTFNTPGTYHYHCQAHGGAGGVGMSGTVTVRAPQ